MLLCHYVGDSRRFGKKRMPLTWRSGSTALCGDSHDGLSDKGRWGGGGLNACLPSNHGAYLSVDWNYSIYAEYLNANLNTCKVTTLEAVVMRVHLATDLPERLSYFKATQAEFYKRFCLHPINISEHQVSKNCSFPVTTYEYKVEKHLHSWVQHSYLLPVTCLLRAAPRFQATGQVTHIQHSSLNATLRQSPGYA